MPSLTESTPGIAPECGHDKSVVRRNLGRPARADSSTTEYGHERNGQHGKLSCAPLDHGAPAVPRAATTLETATSKSRKAPACGAQSNVPRAHALSSEMPCNISLTMAASLKPVDSASTAARQMEVSGATPSRPDTGSGTAGSPRSSGRRSQSHAAVSGIECCSCASHKSSGRKRRAKE